MVRVRKTVSERVIQKVAKSTDRDVLELPPLYDDMDPDALNALIEGMSAGKISFNYDGHEITVTSNGTISIREQPSAGSLTPSIAVSDD